MYAIIKSGGKQYKVKKGDVIDVELLNGENGERIEFADVLFFNDGEKQHVGGPLVSGVTVVGEFVDIVKGPKISSVKYKRSHHQYRKFGHRQKYSRIKITELANSHKKEHAKKEHAKE